MTIIERQVLRQCSYCKKVKGKLVCSVRNDGNCRPKQCGFIDEVEDETEEE